MKILSHSQRLRVIPALILLTALVLPLPAGSVEPQHRDAPPPLKPSALAEHGREKEKPAQRISDKTGLLEATEAPPAQSVGLDEKLGERLPLGLVFRDEDGNNLRLGELVTRPTVIAPVYYRCPNVCHFLQGELAQVLPQLNLTAGSDYQVISFSFDEDETPELARRNRDTYLGVASQRIPAAGWRFLTGSPDAIKTLTGAIGYRFQRVGSDFQHPVAVVVVSADGTIVRYLHGTRILPKDLALALMEAKEGHVGTTIRKMVQYCFSYDPQQRTYVFNVLRVSATVILITLGAFLAFLMLGGKKKPRT